MGIVIAAIAVVGGIIYVLFLLLSYYSDSARLTQDLEAVKVRTEAQRKRLQEYEAQVASLQAERPRLQGRTDRLRRWVELLRNQKAWLETEQQGYKTMGHKQRKAVVLKGLKARRQGKKG